jgi:membrane associated rhomboid family serine protease
MLGVGQTAYWAHLGGFAAGFGLAFALVKFNLVGPSERDRTLIDLWTPPD